MKKVSLFVSVIFAALLYSCTEDPVIVRDDTLGEDFERIMDGNRAWTLSKVESDKPRFYTYSYFHPELWELVTEESKSSDWLSQMRPCLNSDPIYIKYKAMTGTSSLEVPDLIDFNSVYGSGGKCGQDSQEINQRASGVSIEKYNTYEFTLTGANSRLYGYEPNGIDEEIWRDFQVTENRISYVTEKVYNDTSYTVSVELVPKE